MSIGKTPCLEGHPVWKNTLFGNTTLNSSVKLQESNFKTITKAYAFYFIIRHLSFFHVTVVHVIVVHVTFVHVTFVTRIGPNPLFLELARI